MTVSPPVSEKRAHTHVPGRSGNEIFHAKQTILMENSRCVYIVITAATATVCHVAQNVMTARRFHYIISYRVRINVETAKKNFHVVKCSYRAV